MKTIQYFSPEYLANCRQAQPDDILKFLEDFRALHTNLLLVRQINGFKVEASVAHVALARLENLKGAALSLIAP